MEHYDLVVLGSGPAGEKAAVKAAYYGKKVAIVEKRDVVGGAGSNTGTIPSKTLKETALYYSGFYEKGLFGVDKELERAANAQDFFFHKTRVVEEQDNAIAINLKIHGVKVYQGTGRFQDAHTIVVEGPDGRQVIRGEYILIATGSYPFYPPGIEFDGECVHDSDTILTITRIPKSMVIIGAGVIGCEYATIFAVMGTQVTMVNGHSEILTFLDREICGQLMSKMQEDGVRFVLNSRVEDIRIDRSSDTAKVRAKLSNGEPVEAEMFLYAAGRCGNTANLNLEAAGLKANERQLIEVDEQYRTAVPSIYAAGDVIGFPALASTSMDQGRVAVTHMFGLHDQEAISSRFPYGIYTIPEVSTYGLTEEEAKKQGIPYTVGRARYRDLPRGRIMGVKDGMLKLIFHRETGVVLGVHVFGKIATELVHYGVALVDNGETIRSIAVKVYNTPTLHELYKHAAYNAIVDGEHQVGPGY